MAHQRRRGRAEDRASRSANETERCWPPVQPIATVEVAALVGLERRQPAAQEGLDLPEHVDHLGLRLEVRANGGVAAGKWTQLTNVVRVGQDADVEHVVGVERHAGPVGEAFEDER